jgi:hypothetical protein
LTGTDLDVLVLGGGINGALVASELTQFAILIAATVGPDLGICYPFAY